MVDEATAAEQAAREMREGAVEAEEERERIRGLSAEERREEGRPPKPCTGCAQGCPDCERRPSASLDTEAEARARKEEAEEARRNEKLLRDVLRLVNAGYLSKANARFTASPIADVSEPDVRQNLRSLHPEATPFDEAEMADEPAARMRDYRRRATVTKDHFHGLPLRPQDARDGRRQGLGVPGG